MPGPGTGRKIQVPGSVNDRVSPRDFVPKLWLTRFPATYRIRGAVPALQGQAVGWMADQIGLELLSTAVAHPEHGDPLAGTTKSASATRWSTRSSGCVGVTTAKPTAAWRRRARASSMLSVSSWSRSSGGVKSGYSA